MNVLFDHARHARIGLPEAVLCQGKDPQTISRIVCEHALGAPVLYTRLTPETFAELTPQASAALDYHGVSRTAWTGAMPPVARGRVALVSAGTADGPTVHEAARTLAYLGMTHTVYEDRGVAGLWRMGERIKEINDHDVIIVVAGMDAALASVMGGLTPKPVFAVPVSSGYGASRNGETALYAMLASCAPGVTVCNIDNGYGAACASARVINLLNG
jgi:pyridinium-3,5-biscarboxylic acid mononucleotide synthase